MSDNFLPYLILLAAGAVGVLIYRWWYSSPKLDYGTEPVEEPKEKKDEQKPTGGLTRSTGKKVSDGTTWLVQNAKEEIAIIAAFAFLTLVLWHVGYARLDLWYYLPGIIVLSLVLKWVAKERRLVPLAMAIAAFTILGFSHSWPPDPTKTTWAGLKEWAASRPPPAPPSARVATTPQCPGSPFPITLTTNTPVQLNPNGACALDLRHQEVGCIFVKRAGWTGDGRTYGPFCQDSPINPPYPKDVEWVWSAGGTLTGFASLPPPRYR